MKRNNLKVNNTRELFFEFMERYNALQGEEVILKEEVEVLLAYKKPE